MDGLNRVLNGEEITSEESAGEKNPAAAASTESFGPDSVMTYGYCTELLVQLQNSKCDTEAYDIEELRAFLAELGDSIVAFKTDSIVKLHVHTFTPEKVLTKMREVGEFITVKIENMSLQHTSIVEEEKKNSSLTTGEFSKKLPESETNSENAAPVLKTNAVVAVSNGEGIDALFRELGADETVSGGQTNNPSAQDFLDAFEKINAENVEEYVRKNNPTK
jgi:dihydroxyacetone kinase-like predicted kinase